MSNANSLRWRRTSTSCWRSNLVKAVQSWKLRSRLWTLARILRCIIGRRCQGRLSQVCSVTTAEGSSEVAPEAMVVPSSTTTVDVRTSREVSFDLEPGDVRRRLSKLDFRSISVPAVMAVRELVLKHSVGREGKMLAERMFYDAARKYREHDLASGSGPPVSELPASELPSPELAGVALVHHVGREIAAVTADVRAMWPMLLEPHASGRHMGVYAGHVAEHEPGGQARAFVYLLHTRCLAWGV
ncbi:hypothetical protein CYMTET_42601 [Cymbomonas tetramitiformis]|uniref:Uncharacterized protein n=1 Tax=Cymbomonas tetramitiformis TaxID=36881 RepID=A0AAE0C5J3_9CHLO|nr:hypothetical protein CYMTET_42601 [Cymbomonas tetramitiformis]